MYVHDINLEKSRNIYVPIQLSRASEKVTSNLRSLEASFVNILIMFILTVGGFQFYSKSSSSDLLLKHYQAFSHAYKLLLL